MRILIAGSGKIGSLIACLLNQSGRYEVYLGDLAFNGTDVARLLNAFPDIKKAVLDFDDIKTTAKYIHDNKIDAVVSSLPYFLNEKVAETAALAKIHYFDLTEDVNVTSRVQVLAKEADKAFVPQCGLAPGFINLAANSLMKRFDKLDVVRLRVGALPQNSSHALQYALTWSTDGLINEYGNPCRVISQGKLSWQQALSSLEDIELDGLLYEAFHTSGGIGHLPQIYEGKVNQLDYKTIRYPGHCSKIRFLMNDLKLNDDRAALKKILENSVPKTYQDVALIYISVTGWQKEDYIEENYVRKIYPKEIGGILWSAIQVSTASSLCAVLDKVLKNTDHYRGLILQEEIALDEFLSSDFSQPFLKEVPV